MPRAGWHSFLDFRLGRLHARRRRPPVTRRGWSPAEVGTSKDARAAVGTLRFALAGLDVYRTGEASAKVIQAGGARADVVHATRAAVGTVQTGRAGVMSEKSSYEMFRGEDYEITFQVRARDVPAEGIGAWAIQFSMVRCDEAGVPIPGKASLGLLTCAVVDSARGTFRVTIPNAYTAGKEVGLYKWDCRRQNPGLKATLSDGTMRVHAEVTA